MIVSINVLVKSQILIDLTKNNSDISCLNEEEFYKDETYIYYLPCNSKYISVIYNEEKFDIKTALTNKIIKLTDLDKYNIKYIKKEISKEETNKIITNTVIHTKILPIETL